MGPTALRSAGRKADGSVAAASRQSFETPIAGLAYGGEARNVRVERRCARRGPRSSILLLGKFFGQLVGKVAPIEIF